MLVIRLQRTGRKGHAMFRVVVQDSRRTPSSGKVVAWLGSYDPHAKNVSIDKEKSEFYLKNGAQPSERVANILQAEGVKLPGWISVAANKKRGVRNPDKRRSTRPPEPVEEAPAETETAESEAAEVPETEAVADNDGPAEEAAADQA